MRKTAMKLFRILTCFFLTMFMTISVSFGDFHGNNGISTYVSAAETITQLENNKPFRIVPVKASSIASILNNNTHLLTYV
jgi:hypothetical protein